MTERHSFIAAAAIAIAGTVGMASWLALDPAQLGRRAALEQPRTPNGATGGPAEAAVIETEAAVLPPPDAATIAALPSPPSHAAESGAQAPSPSTAPAASARRGATATEPSRPASRSARAVPARPVSRVAQRAPASTVARTARTAPASRGEPAGRAEAPTVEADTRRVDPVPQEAEPLAREVIIPANAVLGVRLATSLSSETAEIEDRVEAAVTRDIVADGRLAVPAGSRLLGSVNDVARGGKLADKARLSVRFHTLVLADGTRAPVRVDSVVREGASPARASAAKLGVGAVSGAIIGGVMNGRKGALIGSAVGAGGGAAAIAKGQRSIASLPAGTPLSVRLIAPVRVMIERNP